MLHINFELNENRSKELFSRGRLFTKTESCFHQNALFFLSSCLAQGNIVQLPKLNSGVIPVFSFIPHIPEMESCQSTLRVPSLCLFSCDVQLLPRLGPDDIAGHRSYPKLVSQTFILPFCIHSSADDQSD